MVCFRLRVVKNVLASLKLLGQTVKMLRMYLGTMAPIFRFVRLVQDVRAIVKFELAIILVFFCTVATNASHFPK